MMKELNPMGTNAERIDTKKATLTDLRLVIKQAEKESYTKDELYELIDTVILKIDQENQ